MTARTRDRGVLVWRCRVCGNVICPARAIGALDQARAHLRTAHPRTGRIAA